MASEFDGGLDETEDEDEDKGTPEVIEVDESVMLLNQSAKKLPRRYTVRCLSFKDHI